MLRAYQILVDDSPINNKIYLDKKEAYEKKLIVEADIASNDQINLELEVGCVTVQKLTPVQYGGGNMERDLSMFEEYIDTKVRSESLKDEVYMIISGMFPGISGIEIAQRNGSDVILLSGKTMPNEWPALNLSELKKLADFLGVDDVRLVFTEADTYIKPLY